MTDLTPKAVKAALGKLVIPQGKFAVCDCEKDNCVHDKHNSAMSDLHFYAPDLAREHLRLKKVEEAAKRLERAAKQWRDLNNPWRADDVANGIRSALAAFRAAVEEG